MFCPLVFLQILKCTDLLHQRASCSGLLAEHSSYCTSSQVQHIRCNQPGRIKRLEATSCGPLDSYFHDWVPLYCTTCPPSTATVRALWFAPPLQASRSQIILRTSLTAFIPQGPLIPPPWRIILQHLNPQLQSQDAATTTLTSHGFPSPPVYCDVAPPTPEKFSGDVPFLRARPSGGFPLPKAQTFKEFPETAFSPSDR
ncbi:hypothetical protein ILYODFUR_016878 [Ilyodon furcidens]|uniref:Uncharacterized protein n=1 Tax=Ilyodon furcidens TaxID=33524 RepID=A0ABV0U739_9TELE